MCDDSWDNSDAQVVCRQLGLTTTGYYITTETSMSFMTFMLCYLIGAVAYSSSYFGQGYGGIFLDNVACFGVESMLVDCTRSSNIGVHNCQHYDDAGVKCQGKLVMTERILYLYVSTKINESNRCFYIQLYSW